VDPCLSITVTRDDYDVNSTQTILHTGVKVLPDNQFQNVNHKPEVRNSWQMRSSDSAIKGPSDTALNQGRLRPLKTTFKSYNLFQAGGEGLRLQFYRLFACVSFSRREFRREFSALHVRNQT